MMNWKLVPVEPTEEMRLAFQAQMDEWMQEIGTDDDLYVAMLAAAPPASQDEELVEKVARCLYDYRNRGLRNCYDWEDSGVDDEHPGVRESYLGQARAVLKMLEGGE